MLTDRHVQRHDADPVGLPQLLQYPVEVSVLAVQTTHDDDAWGFSVLELRPDRLGAHLDAGRRIHENNRAVGDAEGRVLIAGEVGEAGGVDEVDLRAVVREGGECHVDRDVALLLFRVGVQDARAVIDLAEASRRPDRVEEGFDEARLSRSAVADDGHVSDLRGLR